MRRDGARRTSAAPPFAAQSWTGTLSVAAQKHKESCDSYEVNVEVVYDSISYGSGLFIKKAISE